MNGKRSVRFARAIALCGLSTVVVAAACGDEDTSPVDAADVAETSDIADTSDVVDADIAETRETDTTSPDADSTVDGPLAPPDLPRHA